MEEAKSRLTTAQTRVAEALELARGVHARDSARQSSEVELRKELQQLRRTSAEERRALANEQQEAEKLRAALRDAEEKLRRLRDEHRRETEEAQERLSRAEAAHAERLRRSEEHFAEREAYMKKEMEELRDQLARERAARAQIEDEHRQAKRAAETEATGRGIAETRVQALERELAEVRSRSTEELRNAQRQHSDESEAHRATQDSKARSEQEVTEHKLKVSAHLADKDRLEREHGQFRSEIERLKASQAKVNGERDSAHAAGRTHEQDASRGRQELERLRAQLEDSTNRGRDRDSLEAEGGRLKRQNEQLEVDLASIRAEVERLRAGAREDALKVPAEELAAAQQRARTAENDTADSRGKNRSLENELAALRAEAEKLRASIAAGDPTKVPASDLDAARAQAAELEAKLAAVGVELAAAKVPAGDDPALMDRIRDLNEENSELKDALEALQRQLAELEKQLAEREAAAKAKPKAKKSSGSTKSARPASPAAPAAPQEEAEEEEHYEGVPPATLALANKNNFDIKEVPKALGKIFGKGSTIHQKGQSALFQVAVKDSKKYFIKLAGGILVIRVGGGWDRLGTFLMNHSNVLGKKKKKDLVNAQMDAIGATIGSGRGTLAMGSKYVSKKGAHTPRSGF